MPQDVNNTDPARATEMFVPSPCDSQIATGAIDGALGPVAGLPAQIGSCRIEGEIGSGGMGVVLRGHDVDFGRTLAVKVVRARQPDAGVVQRFLQEAQITAQLQHPGVPPVHAVGKLDDGRPFFTMKLIQGRTLEVLLRESTDRAADLPRLLAIFTQICQTLAYAHSHGVIHRDLKPANIMVGAFGEVQVMDWGLAKMLGGAPETSLSAQQPTAAEPPQSDASTVLFPGSSDTGPHTQMGNVMGTLAYMAPEQARGQVHQLDERCDVFGLGAILCVILTGKPPNVGSTKTHLHRQAAKGILSEAWERLDACGADTDLVRLTKVCLSRDRDDRPRHAGIVAEAMSAYQAKIAERLRAAELERAAAEIKAREERKRRKLAVGLAAAVLGVVLLGVGGWWWISQQQAQRAADTARVVNEAIQETTRLRGRAEAASLGDVNPWKEALAVVKRAEDLLASGTPTTELTETVAGLRSDLETGLAKAQQAADAAELDRNMLAWLHNIRLEGLDLKEVGGVNDAEVDRAFAAAFRKYGVDVDNLGKVDATERIRGRPIQGELVAALDLWAWKRRSVGKDRAGWERLFALAQTVEPDPWRQSLRRALAQNDDNELARLAASADVAALPISVQVLLSDALFSRNRAEGGAYLRRAIEQHPADFWINFYLGLYYTFHAAPPNYPEAIRFYTAARVANDRSASLYAMLGYALNEQNALDEAIAAYEKSVRLSPTIGTVHVNLGMAYEKKQLPDKAFDAYQKAIALAPHKGVSTAYRKLGVLLQRKGRPDEALAALEKSLAVNAKEPVTYAQLAYCFNQQKRWDDAIATCKKGQAIDAKQGGVLHQLGLALIGKGQLDDAEGPLKAAWDLQYEPAYAAYANNLQQRGRVDEAIDAYPKALAADPKNAKVRNNYGSALESKKRYPEAIGLFESALELDPSSTLVRKNLLIALRKQGSLLRQQGRWQEAEANHLKLLRHAPLDAPAHFDLGSSYRNHGRFAEAGAAYQKALALQPSSAATIRPMIESCQALLEWDKKLPAFLRGEIQLSNPERVPLTTYCKIKKLYGLGVRTYADMLRITPEFADPVATGVRYDAACAAALASSGAGKDEPPLDDKERTKWRRQALDWLRTDLAAWAKLAGASTADHAIMRSALTKWQSDASLISVRDADALAKLPEAERAEWRQLWQDVAKRLDQLDR